MLVQSIPYPALPIAGGVDLFFTDTGATQPQIGPAIYPTALHDSSSNLTWFGWEGWNEDHREAAVTSLDHDTGYWTPITAVGASPLVDDDHGVPALCLDDEGHLHIFHGSHNTNQLHSSSVAPVAGASMSGLWRINPELAGDYTYPHPVALGSNIYLFLRKDVPANTKKTLVLFKTATLAAGVATWNSEITLVDLDTDSRFYMGTVEAVGTDIHIIATRADWDDTVREHVYYFVYDTTNGAVKNHDGSTTVGSGSLPVTLTQANADFRLFAHSGGNDDGGIPAFCFDASGDTHILFKDGTGTSYAVKYINNSSGSFSVPATIATVDSRYNCPVLAPLVSDWIEAWYSLDPGGAFTRFGNMVRRLRSPAGTWGPEQTIVEADTNGLGNPNVVLNAHPDARVVFSECLESLLDSDAGDLKTYVFGDGGLIPYEQEPAPATTPDTLQLNGQNLQLNGEDLTLGV